MVVAAPVGCSRRALEQSVREKMPWVRRKLAQRADLPARPPRVYSEGEEFPYLGRRHRLLLVDGDAAVCEDTAPARSGNGACAVRLSRGCLVLPADLVPQARSQLVEWYSIQARRRLPGRVSHYAEIMGVTPHSVQVKDLGRRWGTCDTAGRVRLHWQIVLFPPEIGDYVVVHELAHLHELNHSGKFWDRVEQILPDYRQRKAWLRAHADEYAL
jgi:predicted metal-dependent hydrolase